MPADFILGVARGLRFRRRHGLAALLALECVIVEPLLAAQHILKLAHELLRGRGGLLLTHHVGRVLQGLHHLLQAFHHLLDAFHIAKPGGLFQFAQQFLDGIAVQQVRVCTGFRQH